MAKEVIIKINNSFNYTGYIEPFIVQSLSEVNDIPASTNAQAVIVLGSGAGMTRKIRLPGGDWTVV